MRRRIESAVLLGLMLLFAAIAIVAIYRARGSATRTKCTNNLRTLGECITNYRDSNLSFPMATISESNLPAEQRFSYLVDMPLYVFQMVDLSERSKPWYAEENRPRHVEIRGKGGETEVWHWGHFSHWTCPSWTEPPSPDQFSLTHYVGIAGVGADAASLPINSPLIGMFGFDRRIKPEQIMNEHASTLMAIETSRDNGPWVASGYPTVRGLELSDVPLIDKGGQFGGLHEGGANALFADLSVRFLGNSTSRKLFEPMCRITPD